MNQEIAILLECLIDEIRASGDPSEKTILVLAQYENRYNFVRDYFKELNENDILEEI